MNITNQINAGLNDVRSTLISLTEYGKTPDFSDQLRAVDKAKYELDLIFHMIYNHRFEEKSTPWSELRGLVEEEFS